jgi:hypothetical protein
MVMADRQTKSVWSHLDGEAFEGPMTGIEMSFLPLIHTTWKEWQALHPETFVLSYDTEFQAQYRTVTIGMPNSRFDRELLSVDDRLQSEELVLGVMVGDEFVAYPVTALEQTSGVINGDVDGIPIVIFYDAAANAGIAFSREVDGQEAQFELVVGDSFLASDSVRGALWDFSGRSVSGERAGSSLDFVTSYLSEWYGWSAYHPETTIYESP